MSVYAGYLKAARIYMGPFVMLSVVLMQAATIVNAYSLTWWTEDTFNKGKGFYLGIYAALGVAVAVFTFTMGVAASIMGFNVSVKLHHRAITRVMYAPVSDFACLRSWSYRVLNNRMRRCLCSIRHLWVVS